MKESVREWTLTLPKELPPWELKFRWTLECSKSNFKGQNSIYWRCFYTIGKLLKLRCLKWAHMTHLDIWNTSYGQKKSWGSNWQFDSQTLKVENWPRFPSVQVARDISLESSRWGLQLCYRPYLNQRSVHKVMGSKVVGIPTLGTKCHLDVGLMERHRVYYKGEGGGFPQVEAVMNLVSLSLPVACPNTKNAPTMH
jgi:hypothetical protein